MRTVVTSQCAFPTTSPFLIFIYNNLRIVLKIHNFGAIIDLTELRPEKKGRSNLKCHHHSKSTQVNIPPTLPAFAGAPTYKSINHFPVVFKAFPHFLDVALPCDLRGFDDCYKVADVGILGELLMRFARPAPAFSGTKSR